MELRQYVSREVRGANQSRLGFREGSHKHEILRARVESQLRAQLLERKRAHSKSADSASTSRSGSPADRSVSQSSGTSRAYTFAYNESSRGARTAVQLPAREERMRQLEAAYGPTARKRSVSVESKTPPPVLRRRLDRPGRPLVPAARMKDASMSPSNVRKITSRLLPSRPSIASRREPLSNVSNYSLNSTFKSSHSLRSRLADLSRTMYGEEKSPPPAQAFRHRREYPRDEGMKPTRSAMRPSEARVGEPLISGPVDMCCSSLESEDAVSNGGFSLHRLSPSPEMHRRREQVRVDLEQKQRDLLEEFAMDSPRGMMGEGQVLVLESLDIGRSSVSSLTELIKSKEKEIEVRKSDYTDKRKGLLEKRREALEQEMKIKQLEYLRQLEEEERAIARKAESAKLLSESLTEKISNQSREIERLLATKPVEVSHCAEPDREDDEEDVMYSSGAITPEPKMPEMFCIASPSPPAETNCSLGLLASPVEKVSDDISLMPFEDQSESILPVLPFVDATGSMQKIVECEENAILSSLAESVDETCNNDPMISRQEGKVNYGPMSSRPVDETETGKIDPMMSRQEEEVICVETLVTDYVLSSLIETSLSEIFQPSFSKNADPEPATQGVKRNRVDAFDNVPVESPSDDSSAIAFPETIVSLFCSALVENLNLNPSAELSVAQLETLRRFDYVSLLFSIDNKCLAHLISDAFVDLLSSLPPAAAADRAWAARHAPGSKSPLSQFLPQSHTLDHLLGQLKKLLHEHCQNTQDNAVDKVCGEFIDKFGLDEVAFQYNTNPGRDAGPSAEAIELEIISEVNDFIIEAVVTSVAGDFSAQHLN